MRGASSVTRTRSIAATPERLYEILRDAHHQPRWYPGVERVEAVEAERFTQVMRTRRGRPVRIDFAVVVARAPQLVVWHQQIAGTPFARVLESCEIRVALTADPGEAGEAGATTVAISQTQRLRGASRTGALMLRRATRRRLDEALAGLASVAR